MAKKGLSDKFKKEIKVAVEKQIKELATEAAERIFAEYMSVIADFYNEYDPDYYKRTGGLFESHSQPYVTKTNEGGNSFIIAGITISDEEMPEVYHDSAEYVLFESILEGYHGGHNNKSKKIPKEYLQKYLLQLAKEYGFRKRIIDI